MDRNGELVAGKGTYQIKKLRAALEHCRQFRVAVDVGAHVGFWSMQLAKRFDRVEAFEPVAAFRECYVQNLDFSGSDDGAGGDRVVLHYCALGAAPGVVEMVIPHLDGGIDSGGTHVALFDDTKLRNAFTERHMPLVEMRTLDSFGFEDVDFIKIDCEGYELEVLKGARKTLERFRPCVIVEQKPHKLGPNFGIQGTPAVDYLVAMGATVRAVLSGDYILAWD